MESLNTLIQKRKMGQMSAQSHWARARIAERSNAPVRKVDATKCDANQRTIGFDREGEKKKRLLSWAAMC